MLEKYNKNQLIAEIARETGLPKKQVNMIIRLFLEKIALTICAGGKVVLQSFGTFFLRNAKPRRVNDFQHEGERRDIEKRKLPKFKFSDTLVNKVKNK